MPHAEDFYIAIAEFPTLRGRPFGNLTDGFADRAQAWAAASDHFRADAVPTLDNLCIMHIQPDVPARNVTEDFIIEWEIENAPTEEEIEEQRLRDDADDYAHMLREGVW